MSDLFFTLVRPVEIVIAAALARMHDLAAALGLGVGAAWLTALVALVVLVRASLLPLVVRQVRLAHASARSRPALEAIRRRYAGRTDPQATRELLAQTRAARAEHGAGFGCLPALATGTVLFGLFRLLSDVAAGVAVGALDAAAVGSARSADVAGVGIATVLTRLGAGPTAWGATGWIVAGIALSAAAVNYASTRWLTLPNLPRPSTSTPEPAGRTGSGPGPTPPRAAATAPATAPAKAPAKAPGAVDPAVLGARIQRLLPAAAAIGLLLSAPFVPAGVLVYWCVSGLWTAAQQTIVNRWWPTPGSAAHTAYLRRHPSRG